MTTQIRLNKYLATQGVASRRQVDLLTTQGQITVNGKSAVLGQKVDPDTDVILVKNKIIKNISTKKVYLMINKPLHYVSTTSDEQNRPTVLDLIKTDARLYPVGRLDFNSTGLLLLTNDGDFTLKMTHPRFHLPKTYLVTVKEKISTSQFDFLKNNTYQTTPTPTGLKIVLTQGKNRQIRRLCESVGLTVLTLHRISVGPLQLGNLPLGHFRQLSHQEILSLHKIGCIVNS